MVVTTGVTACCSILQVLPAAVGGCHAVLSQRGRAGPCAQTLCRGANTLPGCGALWVSRALAGPVPEGCCWLAPGAHRGHGDNLFGPRAG